MMKKRILSLFLAFIVGITSLSLIPADTAEATSLTTDETELFSSTQFKENMTFLKLLNADRIENEMTPLAVTKELLEAAQIRAKELETICDEKRPNKKYWFTVLGETNAIAKETLNAVISFGITEYYAYEMNGAGSTSASSIYEAFMDKSSATLRRANVTHMGLGHTTGKTTINKTEYSNPWNLILLDKYHPDTTTKLEILNVPTEIQENGTTISDMDIILKLTVKAPEIVNGAAAAAEYVSYMPVIDSMCTGFDKNKAGKQTVTVTYNNTAIDLDNEDPLNVKMTATFTVAFKEPVIPEIPANFTAAGKNYNTVTCTWSPAARAMQYKIYRSTKKASNYKCIATLNAADLSLTSDGFYTYDDSKLTCGKTYYYKITGVNGTFESNQTAYDSAKPIPSKPTIKLSSKTKNSITIKWSKISGAQKYRIYYSKKKTSGYKRAAIVSSNKTSYKIKKLKKNTTYYVRILAYRGSVSSKYSNVLKVKTKKK